MYLKNPIEKKGFKNYIVYDLVGEKVKNPPLLRRYSDFYNLREKLKEYFPGIYIPNIPPKKIIGNKDSRLIMNRMRLLNSFCFKLSTIPYLVQSKLVQLFINCQSDVSKEMDKMKKISRKEIYLQYQLIFKEYYSSYDYIIGKGKINEYQKFFQKILSKLKVNNILI